MSQADINEIVKLLQSDARLNQKPWDKYAYFMYIGEGGVDSSGFRFLDDHWYSGATNCHGKIQNIMGRIRDEGNLPIEERWNAAVITTTKNSETGTLHVFHDLDAEAWDMTPRNQPDVARRAFQLFGAEPSDRDEAWSPLRADQNGLKGRTGKLLTDEPTDGTGRPVELPPSITKVLILDDEPNPNHAVRVYAKGMRRPELVKCDQLAVRDE